MSYMHMKFPGSQRKSYVPHTLFWGFFGSPVKSRKCTNDYITLTQWTENSWPGIWVILHTKSEKFNLTSQLLETFQTSIQKGELSSVAFFLILALFDHMAYSIQNLEKKSDFLSEIWVVHFTPWKKSLWLTFWGFVDCLSFRREGVYTLASPFS